MDQETLFFEEKSNQTVETKINQTVIHDQTVRKIFENICLSRLTTLQGRILAVQKQFGYRYNAPVYLGSGMIFFRIRTDDSVYWINGEQTVFVRGEGPTTVISFRGGKTLWIEKPPKTVRGAYEKALEIGNFINRLHLY
jgi:hypothetical protein